MVNMPGVGIVADANALGEAMKSYDVTNAINNAKESPTLTYRKTARHILRRKCIIPAVSPTKVLSFCSPCVRSPVVHRPLCFSQAIHVVDYTDAFRLGPDILKCANTTEIMRNIKGIFRKAAAAINDNSGGPVSVTQAAAAKDTVSPFSLLLECPF